MNKGNKEFPADHKSLKIIISLNKLNENCILTIDNLTIKFLIIKIIRVSGLYDFRTLLRNSSIKNSILVCIPPRMLFILKYYERK